MEQSGRTGRRVLLAALLLASWPGAGLTAAKASRGQRSPTRVLFIGNSYIFVNNLPAVLTRLAEVGSSGPALETETVAEGGWTLQRHWEAGNALKKIQASHWDYVVLQEQSQGPILDREAMFQYARLFDAEIKKTGARTLFYLTWARENRPEDQAALTDACQAIARELHALVAPVGVAWQEARSKDPSLKLYVEDQSHPTASGTYLAALVFLAVLRGDLPRQLPATVSGLPDPGGPGKLDLTVNAAQIPEMRRAALHAAGGQRTR
jgi:hypothetical protein